MALSADIGIDYTNKRIYATGTMGSTFYAVRDFYSYLMGVFAAAGQMDDTVAMSAQTPFDYTMINGWYLQQGLIKNLRGGTIKTSGYNAAIQLVKFGSTYTNAVSGDLGKDVKQGSLQGTLLDYDNTKKYWWVRSASTFANSTTTEVTTAGGTGTGTTATSSACITGEELFSNVYTLGTVANGNMYVLQGATVLTSWWGVGNADGVGGTSGNHIDVLIKVTEAGTSISSGTVTVFCRNYGDTYDHSSVDLSSGGRNAVALATATDINNSTAEATIAHYVAAGLGGDHTIASVTVTFGSTNIDVDDDGTAEAYDVVIDPVSQTLAHVYEVCKWLTAAGRSSSTQLNGADGRIYIAAGAYTPVKVSPFGTYAGGKFFGARGMAFTLADIAAPDASAYQTVDAANNSRIPPASVSVIVNGLVSGDEVGVFKSSAGAVDVAMFTSHASSNTSGNGIFVQQEAIPNDTPATGYLRVRHGTLEDRYAYTSYNRSTKTFTISGTLARTYTSSDKSYVGYLDGASSGSTLSVALKYVSDRAILARVRNGSGSDKIVPFEVASTITNLGLSVAFSRQSDSINTN